ncbi:transposable element Tcb2 transposase [Trichonephila clavipes]|nr:transposable element Tcb2 transposase [Trichonephila clavipes]
MILKRSTNPCPGRVHLHRDLCSNQQIKIQSKDDCWFFFNIHGTEFLYWVPEGQTINLYYYLHVLEIFHERIRKKLPELWKDKLWILHQDNGPTHLVLSVKVFLAKYSIPVLDHSFYSLNLVPFGFCLFPKVKSALKTTRFQSVEAVKEKVPRAPKQLTQDFQHCFEQWEIFMSVVRIQCSSALDSRLNNAFRFVEWAQNEIAAVPDFHKRILFSDEAHFWLNGYVNKQNCRIWSEANPQVYVETPLHPEKLTVWCALWAGGIIGPYFFKNDAGHNDTVNGDRYRAMITNFFIPELNNHDVQELWFQQDGATFQTARAAIDLLKDTFGDRLISRFGPVNWPPRSCDLAPLDYFLWGYVKSLVYADKPQTLDHLEDNIRCVIADIRRQMSKKSSKIGRPDWTTSELAVADLNRFLETGSAGRRPGQGRRRVTTPKDRYLVLMARRHRNMNVILLQQHLRSATGTMVSTQTVRNRLHGVGLYARRPMVCVRLTSRHRRDRRENNPAFVHESVRLEGGGVLVYGGISIDGRTDLYIIRDGPLTARRYRDEILRPIVVPYAAAIGDDFILMDDNCRPHRANLVEDFLFEEGIVRMKWPACCPDMNPIEHVWDALGRQVAGRQPPPQTLQGLERALLEEWDRIPQLVINSLIDSMPQRCSTLLAVRGNHTPY